MKRTGWQERVRRVLWDVFGITEVMEEIDQERRRHKLEIETLRAQLAAKQIHSRSPGPS
jgi:hypothetical protein